MGLRVPILEDIFQKKKKKKRKKLAFALSLVLITNNVLLRKKVKWFALKRRANP